MPTQGITIKSLPPLSALPEDAILYAVSNDADYKLPISLLKSLILENLPPAEIPEGLLNEDILTARLQNYITNTQIDAVVEAAIPEGLLNEETLTTRLQDYLTTTQVNAAIEAAIPESLLSEEILTTRLQDYLTSAQVTAAIETAIPANLVNEDNLNTRLQDYLTSAQVTSAIETAIPQGLINEDNLTTRLQDYLTSTQVTAAIEAAIPEGLLNEEALTTRLQNYLTSTQVDTAIETAINAIPNYVLPETVVQQSDLAPITQNIQDLQLAVQEFGELSYVTSEQLTTQLSGYIQTLPENIVYQAALETVEERVSELELSEFVTPSQLSAGLQGVVEQFPEPAKPSQLGKVYYVNVNSDADVASDGSIFAPYFSIQDACDAVPEGSVILVSPGVYNEYLTPGNKDILIQGYGVSGNNLVEINGQININAGVVNSFRLKDVVVKNVSTSEPAVKITGNTGTCYFENVHVKLINGTTAAAVELTGPITGEVSFLNCPIEGEVLFNGAPVVGTTAKFKGCSHSETHFKVLANFDVYIDDTTSLKGITHTDGNLYVSRTRGFGAPGLVSTAGAGKRLSVTFTSFRNNDGTFAPYQGSLKAETFLEYVIKEMD